MKPTKTVAIATWMLERMTFGLHDESLSGDLLEEFQYGRSASWYWCQVLSAIGIGFRNKSRIYALPLTFSIGWSMFYPAWWLYIEKSQFAQTMFARWLALDWPFSTSLKLLWGIAPDIAFVWLGFFVYLLSHAEMVRELSKLRLLRSLSISLNVLLIAFLLHLKPSEVDVSHVDPASLYANIHLLALSGALSVSMMAAILFGFPRSRWHRPDTHTLAP